MMGILQQYKMLKEAGALGNPNKGYVIQKQLRQKQKELNKMVQDSIAFTPAQNDELGKALTDEVEKMARKQIQEIFNNNPITIDIK